MLVILRTRRKLPTASDLAQLQSTISSIEFLGQRYQRVADDLLVFLQDIRDRLRA